MSDKVAHPSLELNGWRLVGAELDDLWRRHPDWTMQASRSDTVYCLPENAIDALTHSGPRIRPLLDATQASAEREFTTLCAKAFAVGTVGGKFIWDTPLNPRPASIDQSWKRLAQSCGWTDRDFEMCLSALEKPAPAADRMKGYLGWLLTEPDFFKDVESVRAKFDALPTDLRPAFPLQRPGPALRPLRGVSVRSERSGWPVQEFGKALVRLLDKWSLIQLAAWDLPAPQGPLVPNLLPPTSPAFPRHAIQLSIPFWHPIKGVDDLSSEVVRIQLQAARDLGIEEEVASLPRCEIYGQIAELVHLERAMRARFAAERPPRGLVTRLIRAAADCLGVEPRRVQKLRSAITLCLQGGRHRVGILKVSRRCPVM